MKKIEFDVFAEGQYLYFDIGRLIQIENQTHKSAIDLITKQDLSFGFLTVLLSIGLRQHGLKTPQWYAEKLSEKFSRFELTIDDIAVPLAKAIIGTGIMGKQLYYSTFPDEITESVEEELEVIEKN